jgi:hypothetical protein
MTLDDLLHDVHALEDELQTYERKYGMLSEIFYESFERGEEPPDNASLRDWMAWASAYKIWLRRREQHRAALRALAKQMAPFADVIAKTARHEPIPIPA